MYCRYSLSIVLILSSFVTLADTSAWNCNQDQNGQWSCTTENDLLKKSSSAPSEAPPSSPTAVAEPLSGKQEAEIDGLQLEDSYTASPEINDGVKQPADAAEVTGQKRQPDVASRSWSKPVEDSEITIAQTEPIPMPAQVQAAQSSQKPGWSCKSGSEQETWDCHLVGTDPKGQAKIMEEGVGQFSLLEPAFDLQQEQSFDILQTELKYDPWATCTLLLGSQPTFISQKDIRESSPLDVGADFTEVFDNEIASFSGNVHLRRADQHVAANRATYDAISKTVDLQGNVIYSDEGIAAFSDNALVELGTDQATLRNALFIEPVTPLRGSAAVAYRESEVLNHFKDVAYTSCKPGNQDWIIHASRLKMNKRTGKGAVKHAWLEFKGLPVLYLPYLSFPLDDRRMSGLLTPSFGSTERNGIDINVPYYWNIAPNYDATVWARYLSRRGGMFGGDFRYLQKKTKGSVEFEILPYDRKKEKTRWQGRLRNATVFTDRLRSNIDLNYVSDEDYYEDLGNSLSVFNRRHLYSFAEALYTRPGIFFLTKADNYQVIDKTISDFDKPYRRLPQVLLNLNHSFNFMPLELGMGNEFVYFEHSDRVTGQRLDLKPTISMPIKTPGYFINPKISVQHTQYWLQNQNPGEPTGISRTLPIASIDSGMFFERNFSFGDSTYIHTIEPRLFYLYIPYTDQNDIPLFDTSDYDFTFSQLFRENRFNGPDRVQDANQLTMAMTTRLIDSDSGIQRLNFSLGNIIYFRDREVLLNPNDQIQTNRFSNLISELSAQITDDLMFYAGMQWNPDKNDIDRGNIAFRYRNELNHIVNLGYRYRLDDQTRDTIINQSDISFLLPLYNNWNIIGRWQYSILHNLTVDSFIGLEKESCCWRFRILGRRFVNNVDTLNVTQEEGQAENAFFVQLELKGMTSIGSNVEKFLERNMYGYRISQP